MRPIKSNGAEKVRVAPSRRRKLRLSALEFEAEAELNPATAARAVRRDELRRDHAKILQAACKGKTSTAGSRVWIAVCLPRIAIDDMVEYVKEGSGEIEMRTLCDRRPLSKRSVQVP